MRVGLLIYGPLDTISGGFLYDRKLVEYLSSQGDEVEVLSLPWRAYGLGLLDNLSPRLLKRLRRVSFQVLLQDELAHPSLFWLNRLLKGRVPYPLVAIVHHLRCREARPPWQRRLYAWVERRYLASVDAFICVSRTTGDDVESLVGPGRPLVVANPGGDHLPGAITKKEVAARARAPGPLRLIFVGNLTPRKELHTLLTALAALPRENWHLTVAGSLTMDPPYTQAIRRQIDREGLGSRVALLGSLADAELAAHLSTSHLLAVPSSYEGFGIVYLEAMRLGLPAIAGNNGAAREIITPGEDGFLVPAGDAATLTRCLARLDQDRESLARMSLAAWERGRSHPTWEANGAIVHRFLHALVESRRESGHEPRGRRVSTVIDPMEKGADNGRPHPTG